MSRRRLARASLSAALAVALSVLGAVPVARGQASSPSMTWSAPAPDCPDETYVRAAVQQLLGPDDPSAARVEAQARVERVNDSTWRVHLTTQRDGVTGERVVDSTSCRSLADATALIVALAIDPQRVAANRPSVAAAAVTSPSAAASAPASASAPLPSTSASAPDPAPPPVSARRPAPVRQPVPTTARSPTPPPAPLPPSRFSVFGAIDGDLGTLPRPAYGFTLGAALFPLTALRLEAYGSFWVSQRFSSSSPSAPGAGGDVFLADGGARACWLPLHANLEVATCLGLEVGVLHGQGEDIAHTSSADSDWLAATGLTRLTWRTGPNLALFLDVSFAIPTFRQPFGLDGKASYEAGAIVGRASVGPELRF